MAIELDINGGKDPDLKSSFHWEADMHKTEGEREILHIDPISGKVERLTVKMVNFH
jgi:hypothetical protein